MAVKGQQTFTGNIVANQKGQVIPLKGEGWFSMVVDPGASVGGNLTIVGILGTTEFNLLSKPLSYFTEVDSLNAACVANGTWGEGILTNNAIPMPLDAIRLDCPSQTSGSFTAFIKGI